MSASLTSTNNKNVKKSTPLRILAIFYLQPSTWFSARNNESNSKFNSDLLIYKDANYNNEASVALLKCFFKSFCKL